jgi:uncharacterized membrane protein YkoI
MRLSCFVVMTFIGTATAVAADQKLAMKDLPPAVREAVQRETTGATLKGLAKEVEGGQTFYEAETDVGGHTRDLLFDATGHLVEIEEQIAIDAAPAPVKAALESRGKILSVETVTKGTDVTYEGIVRKNGRKSRVTVDANGKILKK